MIDLTDPTLGERLRRRTPEGRFEISEGELVTTIRSLRSAGNTAGVQRLSEVLLERCKPMFIRCSQGLNHRPDLREEAIANMAEHLLYEVMNPLEVFVTQNFVHYLRCLCVDEFNRVLRQEGLRYRRNDEGQPVGRPVHIPRALIEPIRPTADDEGTLASDVADAHDQYEELHAETESMRILAYLADQTDRTIMVLRAIEGWKWDDIAQVCGYTERTVRSRFERARSRLRELIQRESEQDSLHVSVVHATSTTGTAVRGEQGKAGRKQKGKK
jgi:RNA polymerase sigma factor (sigma-70 family)